MSLMINDECIACDACREECPNDWELERMGIKNEV